MQSQSSKQLTDSVCPVLWLPTTSETRHQHRHTERLTSLSVVSACRSASAWAAGMRPQVPRETYGLSYANTSNSHWPQEGFEPKPQEVSFVLSRSTFLCHWSQVLLELRLSGTCYVPWLRCGAVYGFIVRTNQTFLLWFTVDLVTCSCSYVISCRILTLSLSLCLYQQFGSCRCPVVITHWYIIGDRDRRQRHGRKKPVASSFWSCMAVRFNLLLILKPK